MSATASDVTRITEEYYDSDDADRFYHTVWGGEDIHVGLYEGPDDTIADASRRTVERMASYLSWLGPKARVLDLGAGYGGSARYLASRYGCHVTCLNLSRVENARNEAMNRQQGLSEKVGVVHGSFEDIPYGDDSFDLIWSQDAILHSGNRVRVLEEAVRVLGSKGEMIFTDPMQADHVPDPAVLQPIYDRIHLPNLASVAFYRDNLTRLGLKEKRVEVMTPHMAVHYGRIRRELQERYRDIVKSVSKDYVDRMIDGLEKWVQGAESGVMAWGILYFGRDC
ncbi:MAG: SAM-dependent methyltransferase [Alphaproteobacteria bacterium]